MKLAVSKLQARYGPAQILFDVSFAVGDGEVVALLGRNGAGKSTTLRSIIGLVADRTGAIEFQGDDISRLPTHEIARRGLGWVPEDRRIFRLLSVMENLRIGFDRSGVTEQSYWDLDFGNQRSWSQGELMDEVEAALQDAIRLRLVSDVPVGVFLSGGTDSSLVAAMASRQGADVPQAFSIGFDGPPSVAGSVASAS